MGDPVGEVVARITRLLAGEAPVMVYGQHGCSDLVCLSRDDLRGVLDALATAREDGARAMR